MPSGSSPGLGRDEPTGSRPITLVPSPAPVAGSLRGHSPVEVTAGLLRGRWTAVVLWQLFWGEKRFYQLLREVEGITRRSLAHDLEELERNRIVEKRFRRAGATTVVYALTELGESLKLVLGAMYEWGLQARHRLPPSAGPAPETARETFGGI